MLGIDVGSFCRFGRGAIAVLTQDSCRFCFWEVAAASIPNLNFLEFPIACSMGVLNHGITDYCGKSTAIQPHLTSALRYHGGTNESDE